MKKGGRKRERTLEREREKGNIKRKDSSSSRTEQKNENPTKKRGMHKEMNRRGMLKATNR